MTPPNALRRLASFARTLFRGRALDQDLSDELTAYFEHKIDRLVAQGIAPADARRRVLADEGGSEPAKEGTRAARIGFGAATVLQDLRYGARSMRRAPGFSLVACLTLALGIGASVAMFTVMQSVLWKPLPYPEPDRVVIIEADARGVRNAGPTAREVHEIRARSRTLRQVAIINGVDAHVETGGAIDRVAAASASADLLPALGARPALGRLFTAGDGNVEGPVRSVIISDGLWRRRFGADPSTIGRLVQVNNRLREVVGILPPDFAAYLPESTSVREGTDVWFPTGIPIDSDYRGEGVIGRLAPGATLDGAQRELDALAAQFASEHPAVYRDAPVTFRVSTVRAALTEKVGSGLRALGLAVAFVLLVSCVNVANLLLARASGRTREMAVRRALGAGRVRIVRQLLTESLLLSSIAGAAGLLLGHLGVQLLDWLRPTHLPRQSEVGIDGTVAMFSIAVTLLSGIVFGVLPALRFTSADAQALRVGRSDSPARGSRRLQRLLVVSEIALSIVPLLAAGLMLRSFINLGQAPLGFTPDRIVTAWMPIASRYESTPSRVQLHEAVFDRIRALPGVEAVSAISPPPFHALEFVRRYGRPEDGAPLERAAQLTLMPGFFDAAGTRLIAGRDFTADDIRHQRPVVIVDARIASQLWPDGAVGKRLAYGTERRSAALEVIGVSEPVRMRSARADGLPIVFVPYHRFPIEMALMIRTGTPAAALEPELKRIAREAGTERALFDVWPLREYVTREMAATRFTALVLSGFAIAALLLAAIGLYGTLSYLTSQRSREFGVRLALGASRRQILRLVASEGLVLTAAGAAAGLAGGIAAARALRGLLYGVDAIDPVTLTAVVALVSALAIAACLKPAWSAATVDPTRALRAD